MCKCLNARLQGYRLSRTLSLAGSKRTARDCMVPVMAGERWLLATMAIKWQERKGCLSELRANGSIACSLSSWNHKTYRLLGHLSSKYWFKIYPGMSRFYLFASSQKSPKRCRKNPAQEYGSQPVYLIDVCKSHTNGPA